MLKLINQNNLSDKLNNYRVILGSESPRRKKLLKDLNIDFEPLKIAVKEDYPEKLKKTEITDYLSIKKSKAYKDYINDNTIVITSDTIVWFNDNPIGKPKNNKESIDMLKMFSGNTHEVLTSLCLTSKDKQVIVNDITKVTFHDLTDQEIKFYINNFKTSDKAGAYGIQDWLGYIAVSKIEGTYNNVMGFPTNLLYQELIKF